MNCTCLSFEDAIIRTHVNCVERFYNSQNVNRHPDIEHIIYLFDLSYWNDEDSEKVMEFLLSKGADPNFLYNDYPLGHAVSNGCTKQISILLKYGAEVDIKDMYGRTPLILAILEDNLEGAEILLRNGANINAQDKKGRTSLHYAVNYKSIENVQFLLNQEIDISIKNNNGLTAYDIYKNVPETEEYTIITKIKNMIKNYTPLDIKEPGED